MIRLVAALLAGLLTGAALAQAGQMVTQVLPAGFRSAQELAAILKPLVPAPGSVSAFHNQLIVKTTPDNLEEIKQVLASLDTPPVNLLVSVRRTLDAQVRQDLAHAAAHLRAGHVRLSAGGPAPGPGIAAAAGGSQAGASVHVLRGTSTRQDSGVQSLRVLEGREAFIHTGESVPVGERSVTVTGAGVAVSEGVRYEEFGTGFYVRPRLNGNQVTLDIIPARRELRGDGSAQVQRAATVVSGVLGRWMEIAGAGAASAGSHSGVTSSRTTTTRREDAIYVKVERLE